MSFLDKAKPVGSFSQPTQNQNVQTNNSGLSFASKIRPVQPSREDLVMQRQSQGLPVGKKADGSPTLGGTIVRGAINPFARVIATASTPIKAITQPKKYLVEGKPMERGFDSKYLGRVNEIGFRDNKQLSTGQTFKEATGVGFELGSFIPVAGGAKAGVQLTKEAIKKPTMGVLKKALPIATEGAVSGGLGSAGLSLQNDETIGKTIGNTALGVATGFGIGGALGLGAGTIAGGISKQFTNRGIQQKANEALNKAIGIKGKKSAGAFLNESEGTKRIQALKVLNREAQNIDVVNEDGILEKFDPNNAKFGTTVQALSKTKSRVYEQAQQILNSSGVVIRPDTSEVTQFLNEVIQSPAYGETSKNFARTKLLEISKLGNIVDADKYLSNELSPLIGQALAGRDKINAKLAVDISQKLRNAIDNGLNTVADAPRFRELYSDYSALKSIEDNLVQSAQKAARRAGSGLSDYVDIFAVPEVLTGVITANPTLIATGTGRTLLNQLFKSWKDPQRQLRNAFRLSNKVNLPKRVSNIVKTEPMKALPEPAMRMPGTVAPDTSSVRSTTDLVEFYRMQGLPVPENIQKPEIKVPKKKTTPKKTNIPKKNDITTSIQKAKASGQSNVLDITTGQPLKYKETINIQDKNDLEYLRRIFSDDTVVDIKNGKKTNWRGEPFSDVAGVNIISETPKTIAQQLEGKIKDIRLKSETFYHGTSAENAEGIMKSGFKFGKELPENTFRGGGYGKMQNSISLTETPKDASRFSELSKGGKIIEVTLKPNSKIVSIDGIEDAIDLENYIPYLKKQKVDAVYIGAGEKELVIINKNAIKPTRSKLKAEWDKVKVTLPKKNK